MIPPRPPPYRFCRMHPKRFLATPRVSPWDSLQSEQAKCTFLRVLIVGQRLTSSRELHRSTIRAQEDNLPLARYQIHLQPALGDLYPFFLVFFIIKDYLDLNCETTFSNISLSLSITKDLFTCLSYLTSRFSMLKNGNIQ